MTNDDAATRALLVRMTYGYMTSQMIRTAVELRVPELLRDGPRGSDELAALTGAHPRPSTACCARWRPSAS